MAGTPQVEERVRHFVRDELKRIAREMADDGKPLSPERLAVMLGGKLSKETVRKAMLEKPSLGQAVVKTVEVFRGARIDDLMRRGAAAAAADSAPAQGASTAGQAQDSARRRAVEDFALRVMAARSDVNRHHVELLHQRLASLLGVPNEKEMLSALAAIVSESRATGALFDEQLAEQRQEVVPADDELQREAAEDKEASRSRRQQEASDTERQSGRGERSRGKRGAA